MWNYSNVSLSTELFSTEDEVIMLHNNFNLFELWDVIIDPTANQFEYDYYLQCFDAYVSLDCCRSSPIAFIPQGKTKINSPKPSYWYKSRIFIDNFRIKYSLFWHDAFCIKQLNDWLDNLKKNELLEVVIDISMNRKPIEIDPSNKTISKEAYHLIFEHANNNPNLISQEYEETWNKILSKNLYNLKIAQPLDEEWIINTLTNSFKSTTNGISKTLKSIDIRLANVEFVEKIINSLRYTTFSSEVHSGYQLWFLSDEISL